MSEDPRPAKENPRATSEAPHTASGTSRPASETPRPMSADPQATSGTPRAAGETPQAMTGVRCDNPFPAIQTDLYQLTMAAAYFAHGMNFPATFELTVRRLPQDRGYLVAAGLEQAAEYLEGMRFSGAEIDYLRRLPVFAEVDPRFFEMLRGFRFSGSVRAMPEGTLAFPHEPLLQVTAPIIEAQIVETWLLSMVNFQTLIATKAARVVESARGCTVIEFGLRRAHGPGAGDLAARASYIGGCAGTSDLLAGMKYGIPVFGTAAHSWILACPSEEEAFRRYHAIFPKSCILLIDTYDTVAGARKAAAVVGPDLRGVRLDSGDFLALSREVRKTLDAAGLRATKIVLSGDMNEYKIDELLRQDAPVDIFGVGTELVVSKDQPALGGVYKLVETFENGARRYVMKFSEGKVTYPGKKQVFRGAEADMLGLEGENVPGTPVLVDVMAEGRRVRPAEGLEPMRERARSGRESLPERCRRLVAPEVRAVEQSPGIRALVEKLSSERR